MYVIGNVKDEGLYHSRSKGWVTIEGAEVYNREDCEKQQLPEDGYWCPLWSVDIIQFVRLIYESHRHGLYSDKNLQLLSEAMELTKEQILTLVERADNRYEEICLKIFNKYSD